MTLPPVPAPGELTVPPPPTPAELEAMGVWVVQLCEDGWAWRCWACGWHGTGYLSEASARRDLHGHTCEPPKGGPR